MQGWLDRASGELHPYWAQFAFVLLAGLAAKVDGTMLSLANNAVRPEFRPYLPRLAAEAKAEAPTEFRDLFERGAAPQLVVSFYRKALMQKFKQLAETHEQTTGQLLGAGKVLRAQAIVSERLAARGEAEALTQAVFLKALKDAG